MLSKIVLTDLQLSGFVDDHSLRKEFSANDRAAEKNTINSLENCMLTIDNCMDAVR